MRKHSTKGWYRISNLSTISSFTPFKEVCKAQNSLSCHKCLFCRPCSKYSIITQNSSSKLFIPYKRPSFEHAGLQCNLLHNTITFDHCFTLSSKLTFRKSYPPSVCLCQSDWSNSCRLFTRFFLLIGFYGFVLFRSDFCYFSRVAD